MPAVDLKTAQIDALVLDLAGGQLGHLAHALPAGVIDVPGALALMLHAVSSSAFTAWRWSSAVGL